MRTWFAVRIGKSAPGTKTATPETTTLAATTDRAALPDLQVEVVAGNQRKAVNAHSNAIHLDVARREADERSELDGILAFKEQKARREADERRVQAEKAARMLLQARFDHLYFRSREDPAASLVSGAELLPRAIALRDQALADSIRLHLGGWSQGLHQLQGMYSDLGRVWAVAFRRRAGPSLACRASSSTRVAVGDQSAEAERRHSGQARRNCAGCAGHAAPGGRPAATYNTPQRSCQPSAISYQPNRYGRGRRDCGLRPVPADS